MIINKLPAHIGVSIVALSLGLLTGCNPTGNVRTNPITASVQSPVSDFIEYKVNCGMPTSESFLHKGSIYRFKLKNLDVGKCSTDTNSFTTESYHKDFSERAEIIIKSPKLRKDGTYKISFNHRVIQGYDNGDRNETFFQMKNCGDSRVPIMAFLRMDASPYKRYAFSLSAGTKHGQFVYGNDSAKLRNKEWYSYEIYYNTSKESWIEVLVDGKVALPKTSFENVGYCDDFDTLRIGNYRSGADSRIGKANTTSISEYTDLKIIKLSD